MPRTIAHITNEAASEVADIIDSNFDTRRPSQEGEPLSAFAREGAATAIIDFTASLIASAIDAGSEREVILEDEEFRNAVEKVLAGW